jgi:hypothetical protein
LPSRNSDAKTAMSPGTVEFVGSSNAHVQEVVKAAAEDLRQLIRQRAEKSLGVAGFESHSLRHVIQNKQVGWSTKVHHGPLAGSVSSLE